MTSRVTAPSQMFSHFHKEPEELGIRNVSLFAAVATVHKYSFDYGIGDSNTFC